MRRRRERSSSSPTATTDQSSRTPRRTCYEDRRGAPYPLPVGRLALETDPFRTRTAITGSSRCCTRIPPYHGRDGARGCVAGAPRSRPMGGAPGGPGRRSRVHWFLHLPVRAARPCHGDLCAVRRGRVGGAFAGARCGGAEGAHHGRGAARGGAADPAGNGAGGEHLDGGRRHAGGRLRCRIRRRRRAAPGRPGSRPAAVLHPAVLPALCPRHDRLPAGRGGHRHSAPRARTAAVVAGPRAGGLRAAPGEGVLRAGRLRAGTVHRGPCGGAAVGAGGRRGAAPVPAAAAAAPGRAGPPRPRPRPRRRRAALRAGPPVRAGPGSRCRG